jgi:hypothetical protein
LSIDLIFRRGAFFFFLDTYPIMEATVLEYWRDYLDSLPRELHHEPKLFAVFRFGDQKSWPMSWRHSSEKVSKPRRARPGGLRDGIDGRYVSVLVREEFLIDAKIRSYFRRIWTHVQGFGLRNDVTIGFRHSFLLQHILSPGWNHHFETKRVEPARIFEQLPTIGAVAQVDQPDFTH